MQNLPDGENDPVALQQRASHLWRAGQIGAAIDAYRRLLSVKPDLPNSWFNLAILQRTARRFDDALESYRTALTHAIDDPEEVHLQRGVIFADDLNRSDAALGELEAALAINPHYVPALLNLGNLRENRGEWGAAREAYAKALAKDPDNALALARLAGVSDIDRVDDPLIRQIEQALSRPGMSPSDRADLGFALGAVLDRSHAYDAAFRTYEIANAAAREIASAADVRYDRAAQETLIDRLIASFPTRAIVSDEADAAPPVFICGMFRSGSTLVEQILGRHAAIVPGGELDVLPALIQSELLPYPTAAAAMSDDRRSALRTRYRRETAGLHPPGTVLTDKRPDNFLHIGLIKTLFPTARIIHTVREERDNCLSVYFLHADPTLSYATDLSDTAHYLAQERRLLAHWRALYPDDIFDLHYDDLVASPKSTVASLLDFCGLPWNDAVLDQNASTNPVRTASHWQVRQPLYRKSSGRWRNYQSLLNAGDWFAGM